MYLVTPYVGHKNATNFIIDYDSQLLLPLMLVSYKSLMPTTIEESNHALIFQVNSKDLFTLPKQIQTHWGFNNLLFNSSK
jgi:hypothetical protein